MKHVTLVDIARKLEHSPSTVSRALSDHPDIRTESKEAVPKLAQELRYSPNQIAKSLKNSRTTLIGVIVPKIKHDFFSSAIAVIVEAAYPSGYSIILCRLNESYEREVPNTSVLAHYRVAGIIVSIAQDTKCCEHFQEILRRKIHLVFFNRACEDVPATKVVFDDYKSAFNAVTRLVQRGYKV